MGQLIITCEQVEQALTDVRQFILSDGGDLEIVTIDGYKIQIRLKGACISCPLSLCARHGRDLPVKVWGGEDNEVTSLRQGCPPRGGI